MGKSKEVFMNVMEEDYEREYLREKAFIEEYQYNDIEEDGHNIEQSVWRDKKSDQKLPF